MNNTLPSRFQIGQTVFADGRTCTVASVRFTESKVIYTLDYIGVLRELPSDAVSPAE